MKGKELDRRLRAFEKKHPIKKERKRKSSLGGFVSSMERQLDRLEKKKRH